MTLKELLRIVQESFDADQAYEFAGALSSWHRLPVSATYHRAAEWARDHLVEWGLEADVHSCPTDGQRSYWSYVTPPRWECRAGCLEQLTVGGPVRLADFSVQPLSVLQRSLPTGGVLQAELVVVDGGKHLEDYPEDLAGKLILTNASIENAVEYGVRQRGALGIITDAMTEDAPIRTRASILAGDLAEHLEWAALPYGRGRAPAGFGFVLSPAAGQRLRTECENGPVTVRFFVDATLDEGSIENVSALLSADCDDQTGEEIWVVSHLCHPAPFAHDNASGAAVLLECARTLAALRKSGQLPPLRRGIRFLLPVEISGTIAYLSEHPNLATRGAAGLNLDMVGARQEVTGSVLCIDRPPDACPSCTTELLEAIYDELGPRTTGLSGNGSYPLFRVATTAFSAGSDHWVLSDPGVGIPTPMLIEWPDRYYHTTGDLMANLDLSTLQRNGAAAAAYAVFLAAAGPDEAAWLAQQAVGRFVACLGRLYAQAGPESSQNSGPESDSAGEAGTGPEITQVLRYRVERQKQSLRWLQRFGLDEEELTKAEAILETAAAALGAAPASAMRPSNPPDDDPLWEARPRSVFPGPISHFAHLGTLSPEQRDAYRQMCGAHAWAAKTIFRRITHWMDGDRTIAEIADLLFLELGRRDDDFLLAHVRMLKALGLVATDSSPAGR